MSEFVAVKSAPVFSVDNFRRKSRAYVRLRDHAAFTWATGAIPSHLREESKSTLLAIATEAGGRIPRVWADHLRLDEHPMVREVAERRAAGWIVVLGPQFERNGFSFVRMRRGAERVSVLINGSILPHWDGPSRR